MSSNPDFFNGKPVDSICTSVDPSILQMNQLSSHLNEISMQGNPRIKQLYENLSEVEKIRRQYMTAKQSALLKSAKCIDYDPKDFLEMARMRLPIEYNKTTFACYWDPDSLDSEEARLHAIMLNASMPSGFEAADFNLGLSQTPNVQDLKNYRKLLNFYLKNVETEKKSSRYLEARQAKDLINKVDLDKMNKLVGQISDDERFLYDEFYKKNSATDKAPNSCRDFLL